MTSYATAIRRATLAVARLHRDLGIQAKVTKEIGRIDIFDVIARLDLPLIFRPLDGLLGAYLHEPSPGVLVTTKRPLSVQRFTAAHELAHHFLKHSPSLDDENVLRRVPFSLEAGGTKELEANAFAAAFLMPRWLLNWHCERQGWTDATLANPGIVYQLALRVGTSYEAACWTLYRYGVLSQARAREIAAISPKSIKQHLLSGVEPEHYYGDVWVLTERDKGSKIEGGPSDLFVMRLSEHSGSGYLWHLENLDDKRFEVVKDWREKNEKDEVDGLVVRGIIAKPQEPHAGEVRLSERRPWKPNQALTTIAITYELLGSEGEGWSRAERRHRLEAAA